MADAPPGEEGGGSIERGAAQIVIITILLATIVALLNCFKRGIVHDTTEALYDIERRRRREAEEASLSAEELVRKRLKDSSRKWGSDDEMGKSFANAIQRLKRTQDARMKEVGGLRRKLKMERHEALLPWKTLDGKTAEATIRAAITVLDESFERLTEATGQYSSGLNFYINKGEGVKALEQARTEFGERLIDDIIKLVVIITEMRLHPATIKPWTEAQEIFDDGDRLDEWARNQVRQILAAEEMAVQRAYLAHDFLMDIEASYSSAEPDHYRRLRREKELRLMGISNPAAGAGSPHQQSQSSSPQEPPSTQPPMSESERRRMKLYRDQMARDSATVFWEAEAPSENSSELFGNGAAGGDADGTYDAVQATDVSSQNNEVRPKLVEPAPEVREEIPVELAPAATPAVVGRGGQASKDEKKSPPHPPPRSDRAQLNRSKSEQRATKATSPPVPPTATETEKPRTETPRATGASPKRIIPNRAENKGATAMTPKASKRTGSTGESRRTGGKGKAGKLGMTLVALFALAHGTSGAGLGVARDGENNNGTLAPPLNTTATDDIGDADASHEDADPSAVHDAAAPATTYDDRGKYTDEWFDAYDCRDLRYPERRVIDVTRIGDCPNSERDFKGPKEVKVAVLQAPVPIRVEAQRCRAWMEKTAHGCGNLHLNYGFHVVEPRAVFQVTREDCANLIRTKQWECKADKTGGCWAEHGSGVHNIAIGVENVIDWTSRGSHDDAYNCHDVTSWVYKNKVYGGSGTLAYEKTKVHLMAEVVYGSLNREEGTVEFPKLGMFNVDYKAGEKDGDDLGYVYWAPQEHSCGEEWTVITNGSKAQLYLPTKPHHVEPYRDAIALLEEDERVGGFLIKGPDHTCIKGCFRTQVPSIRLCLDEVHQLTESLNGIKLGDPDPQTRAEMGIVVTYSLYESKLWTQDKFRKITAKLCDLSRGAWWSLISSTQQHPREMEYLLRKMDLENPQSTLSREGDIGYNIITAAGAIIIEECPVVSVRLTTHQNCTENIPVRVESRVGEDSKDELAFVDPVTRTIEPYPRVTICNDAYPSHFLINDRWVCSSPEYHPCGEIPTKLAPDVSWDDGVTMEDVTSFKPTLYSDQAWTDAKNYRKAVHAREAMIKELLMERTNKGAAASGSALGFNMVGISWEKFVEELNDHLWGPSTFIVRSLVFILAGIILLMMLRWFLVTMLQIFRYLVKRGPGFWIVYAIYNSLFVTFSVPQRILEAAHQMTQRDVDRIIPPGEDMDESRVRVVQRRLEDMEVRVADLSRENMEMRRLLAASGEVKTAEEKMSMLRHNINEENDRQRINGQLYKRLRMGPVVYHEPGAVCAALDSGMGGTIGSGEFVQETNDLDSNSTESELAEQSLDSQSQRQYPNSSSESDDAIPPLEMAPMLHRPRPSLGHGHFESDSDAPGRNDATQ